MAREAADAESPEDDAEQDIDPLRDADLDALTSDEKIEWDDALAWEAEPIPGAAPVILDGTLDDVYDQLKEINPNYDTDFKDIIAQEQAAEGSIFRSPNHDVQCWDAAKRGASIYGINTGIQTLRRIARTRPVNGHLPGGSKPVLPSKKCRQAVCHHKKSIWWCNDVRTSLSSN